MLRMGPFKAACEPLSAKAAPAYLALLNLKQNEDVYEVRARILLALNKSRSVSKDVISLFRSANWRPHLVGCTALLLMEKSEKKSIQSAWQAADRGSWVTPQIAATLRLIDASFEAEVQERIHSCFEIKAPGLMSMLARHSATGPAGQSARVSKYAASCIAMLDPDQSIEQIIETQGLSERLEELIKEDIDNSAVIAQRWFKKAHELLA